MIMNSYKYYQAEYRASGQKEKKSEQVTRDFNLFFII